MIRCLSIVGLMVGAALGDDDGRLPPVKSEVLKDVTCFVQPKLIVSADQRVPYKRGHLYFSSREALERYRATPKAFEAWANHQLLRTKQYVQGVCPLSGETPDEDSGVIRVKGVELKLLCPDCAKEISKEPVKDQIDQLFDAEAFELGRYHPRIVTRSGRARDETTKR
ncbi:MAG: hypothetical protein AAFU85_22240 [Planctomycetota bacterium]